MASMKGDYSIHRTSSSRALVYLANMLIIIGLLFLPGEAKILTSTPGNNHSYTTQTPLQTISGTTATYVIVMIGDGMGPEHVQAARYYKGQPLSFETLLYRSEVETYSANNPVTDSAAAATAMATGVKVDNAVISVALPGDSSELLTSLEAYQAQGKKAGLVSTTYITHATPAAWGAHETNRTNYLAIAGDLLAQTKPNVLFGGAKYLTPPQAVSAGYFVVQDRASMQAVDTGVPGLMVSGQFGSDNLPFEFDGLGALPHLSEMTVTALEILANDPDGFFLMVEGGRIDHAAHNNDLERNIFETIEFGRAVQEVIDWIENPTNGSNWRNTLLLVTADHETGGLMVVNDNGAGNLPTAVWLTTGHTAANVYAYAQGPGAFQVTGILDNTDIYKITTAAANFTSQLPFILAGETNQNRLLFPDHSANFWRQ